MNFYASWKWLEQHPLFCSSPTHESFDACLQIDVVKVNPLTKKISDFNLFNLETNIWIEVCIFDHDENNWCNVYRLSCGARNFKKAIIKVARLVKKHYGDYEKGDCDKIIKKYLEEV